MKTDDALLNKELRRDEGVRYSPYFCSEGVKTVGVGHNMKAKPIPTDWTFPLTDAQIDQLLADDLAEVFTGLDKRAAWWRDLSYPRQRVLANMAFNLGIEGLLSFKRTLQAIQEGRYGFAASGMMNSLWAKQVGDRASRLAAMMRAG